jgi:hypothetical protein
MYLPLIASTRREGRDKVDAKLDIFVRLPDGHPIWVKAVEGLEEAKRQLAQMANENPGKYFIFNTRSGLIVVD